MNEKQRLRGLDRIVASSSDRDSLLSSSDGKSYGRREGEATRDMNTEQLLVRGRQEMAEQDQVLDVMSKGLDNLKGMGMAIRDETTLQMVRCGGWRGVRRESSRSSFTRATCLTPLSHSSPRRAQKLLDDMENEVDAGNANLKRETERTAMVTADSKTCWLYGIICILIAVLVALVAIRYG